MTRVAVVLAAAAACSSPPARHVPGAPVAPHLHKTRSSDACALDVSWSGGPVDLRYHFAYDTLGRLAHARGIYTAGGTETTLEYSWDNLDRMMSMVQTYGLSRYTIEAHYNTLGDLLEYTRGSGGGADDRERYVFSDFNEAGQPTRELITTAAGDQRLTLEYDAFQRLTRAVPESGTATIYTYDDDARTMAIDTDDGAYAGLIIYDDQDRTLSATWGGTGPGVVAREELYEYDGDRLLRYTLRSGSESAPHDLHSIEIDTYVYDCVRPD